MLGACVGDGLLSKDEKDKKAADALFNDEKIPVLPTSAVHTPPFPALCSGLWFCCLQTHQRMIC